MGLIPSFCRLLIMMHKRVRFSGPVLTLGNQDIWASYDELKSFFQELDCDYVEPQCVLPHTSALFNRFPLLIQRARSFVHAATFFQMLGIDEYWDLDVSDYEKARIIHDLNFTIPADFHDKYNLIVDGGTIEHVFDIHRAIENIIRMCKVSGWVIHINPASNFLDHGFYSFSPTFFYDVYSANGFDNLTCYIVQHHSDPKNYFDRCRYFEYTYGMSCDELLEPNKKIVVFFLARKYANVNKMNIPIQGFYMSSQHSANLSSVQAKSEGWHNSLIRLIKAILPPSKYFASLVKLGRRSIFPRYLLLKKI